VSTSVGTALWAGRNHLTAGLAGLATQVVAAVSAAVLRPSLGREPTNKFEVDPISHHGRDDGYSGPGVPGVSKDTCPY
jgi:hypothetical protein